MPVYLSITPIPEKPRPTGAAKYVKRHAFRACPCLYLVHHGALPALPVTSGAVVQPDTPRWSVCQRNSLDALRDSNPTLPPSTQALTHKLKGCIIASR